MTGDQKRVAIGALSGVAVMAVSLWLLYPHMPSPTGAEQVANRIAYALKWDAFAILPFVAMLVAIGNARALSEAIDPTLGKETAAMLVDGRVASNTLEQFILFATGSLALAVSLQGSEVRIVGAAAIVFVVMRFAFWIGYRIRPVYRAFGLPRAST